ncbi:MAG: response regulator [Deltaproteobacteria bacterium]|nr:response regulator [Deltaproteobacteria bacterium]
MTETEKLQQQVEVLKDQLDRQKKTNSTLKKMAFRAVVKGHSFDDRDIQDSSGDQGRFFADQSSHIKNNFLENVSHEIRSSMNGIVGMTSLAMETGLSGEQKEYMEMVNLSVERLLGVVNQVIDYSRIESGQLDLKKEDFDLKESLDHDLYLLRLAAQEKGLKLLYHIDPSVPSYIHGDRERLVQVVVNLVDNGIKFTDIGSVSIKIEQSGYDNNNNLLLKFTIADTGCGITESTRKVITRYFGKKQSNYAPQPLVVGSAGLGLTVVSQLVKIMGGTIEFDSDSSGSAFCFTLPVKEATGFSLAEEGNRALENIEERTTYGLKGKKILLAEDEYINRVLVETVLQQLGMEVVCVESGDEAVQEGCGGDYDGVLMDVQMEKTDGLEATRKIREYERKNGGHLPIIALTALAMQGDREKCLQAGMDDYLPKPVERDQLVDLLNKYLTSRALLVVNEVETQQSLVHTLIESGWRVTIAETRRSAMYEAALSYFDLVVLDTASPELEGLKAVESIRQLEDYSGKRATVIGLGGGEDEDKCLEHGVDDYIATPLTEEKIRMHLEPVSC